AADDLREGARIRRCAGWEISGKPQASIEAFKRSLPTLQRQKTQFSPMKQPAVVNFSGERFSVELREVERPTIGPDDVLLKVAAVGVCGSDLHQWTADHSWPVNYPVILGHEFGGTIAELGPRVGGWKEGDRVVSE